MSRYGPSCMSGSQTRYTLAAALCAVMLLLGLVSMPICYACACCWVHQGLCSIVAWPEFPWDCTYLDMLEQTLLQGCVTRAVCIFRRVMDGALGFKAWPLAAVPRLLLQISIGCSAGRNNTACSQIGHSLEWQPVQKPQAAQESQRHTGHSSLHHIPVRMYCNKLYGSPASQHQGCQHWARHAHIHVRRQPCCGKECIITFPGRSGCAPPLSVDWLWLQDGRGCT